MHQSSNSILPEADSAHRLLYSECGRNAREAARRKPIVFLPVHIPCHGPPSFNGSEGLVALQLILVLVGPHNEMYKCNHRTFSHICYPSHTQVLEPPNRSRLYWYNYVSISLEDNPTFISNILRTDQLTRTEVLNTRNTHYIGHLRTLFEDME